MHDPIPEPAAEALPPLPQRRRHTCTREQLTGALAHAQAATTMIGPPAAGSYPAKVFAEAVLSQLPLLGADLAVTAAPDLRSVLADASRIAPTDPAAWNRCAQAAGLTHD